MALGLSLVPMLDGVRLLRDERGTLAFADGTALPASRIADVVFKLPDDEANTTVIDDDMASLLADFAPPVPEADVDAGFFHRTLGRWLGLPLAAHNDSMGPTAPPITWDYDFWKAELVPEHVDGARHTYRALVHRTADRAPMAHRYWVDLDDCGRIRASGWLTRAPELLGRDLPAPSERPLHSDDLLALFQDLP
jgi:hypothetical protein